MQQRSPLPRPLPRWLVVAASLVISAHLFCLVIVAITAPSGPWPTPFGVSQALPPTFAGRISEVTTRYYLRGLRMDYNYHYATNRPDSPGVYFEVRLRDAKGEPIETVRFPSPKDNPWLRLRHEQLAQGLAGDEPVELPRGEAIAPVGKDPTPITYWFSPNPEPKLKLKTDPIHLIPKEMPVSRPRQLSLLFARSYSRYLARKYDAASAEVVRFSRQPVMPALLFLPDTPPGAFDTLESHFEEYRREN